MKQGTIVELGNGLPSEGDLVPGTDGELYKVMELVGPIHTSPSGSGGGNYIHAKVEWADWDDTESDDDVHSSQFVEENLDWA